MARPGGLELSPYPRLLGLVLASLDGHPPFSGRVDPEKRRPSGHPEDSSEPLVS